MSRGIAPRLLVEQVRATAAWALASGGTLSGHDGEWLAVRAGALGRALELGAAAVIEKLVADIDGELAREAAAMAAARRGDAKVALMTATVLAHNLGDLSRVVEE